VCTSLSGVVVGVVCVHAYAEGECPGDLTRVLAPAAAGTVVIGSTTPPKGTWKITIDSKSVNTNWAAVTWDAAVPAQTELVLEYRVANAQASLCGAFEIFNGTVCVQKDPFIPLEQGKLIGTRGQYFQVRARCGGAFSLWWQCCLATRCGWLTAWLVDGMPALPHPCHMCSCKRTCARSTSTLIATRCC
jgi:hypothetical protein